MTGSTFTIHRTEDPSGVSGTGVVAEGWESSSGEWVVLVWLSDTPSMEIHRDIRRVEEIHGHGGKSQIVWDSPTQYTPTALPADPEPTDGPYFAEQAGLAARGKAHDAGPWCRSFNCNYHPDDPLATFDREDR